MLAAASLGRKATLKVLNVQITLYEMRVLVDKVCFYYFTIHTSQR